uniref:Nucleoside diphosphate-linked moiety X motif 19, mitochondrial n=1 Tax=Hydra vulgaris TaxID=6087 RepID=T2MJF6_HYDVU
MNNIKFEKCWRDAATLVIAAKSGGLNKLGGNLFNVLMLKRNENSKFMPNSYVFPGGVVSSADFKKEWVDVLPVNCQRSLSLVNRPYIYTSNSSMESLQPELAFRICALRETFEECGVLLVTNDKGESIALSDPNIEIGGQYHTLKVWREKINNDANEFLALFRCSKLLLNIYNLFEWSTWLTPAFKKSQYRFDTIFYTCFLPDIPPSKADKCEVVESVWCSPKEFLNNHRKILPPPQVYELLRIQRHNDWNEFKQFAKDRERFGLQMWCPYQISLKDGRVLTCPGDDYHCLDPNKEHSHLDCTIEDLRNSSVNLNRYEVSQVNGNTIKCNVEWYGHPPVEKIYSSL